jgi:hypothetical protein
MRRKITLTLLTNDQVDTREWYDVQNSRIKRWRENKLHQHQSKEECCN